MKIGLLQMEMMISPLVLDVELNFDYDFNDPLNARSDDNEISNNTDIKLECFSGTMNTRRIKYNKIVISCVFFKSRPDQYNKYTATTTATAAATVTTTIATVSDEWL